jgi:hypothetical protein
MKVTFKRQIYITLEFDENLDRGTISRSFRAVIDPEFKEFVSSIQVRNSVRKALGEILGKEPRISFSDHHEIVKKSNEENFHQLPNV